MGMYTVQGIGGRMIPLAGYSGIKPKTVNPVQGKVVNFRDEGSSSLPYVDASVKHVDKSALFKLAMDNAKKRNPPKADFIRNDHVYFDEQRRLRNKLVKRELIFGTPQIGNNNEIMLRDYLRDELEAKKAVQAKKLQDKMAGTDAQLKDLVINQSQKARENLQNDRKELLDKLQEDYLKSRGYVAGHGGKPTLPSDEELLRKYNPSSLAPKTYRMDDVIADPDISKLLDRNRIEDKYALERMKPALPNNVREELGLSRERDLNNLDAEEAEIVAEAINSELLSLGVADDDKFVKGIEKLLTLSITEIRNVSDNTYRERLLKRYAQQLVENNPRLRNLVRDGNVNLNAIINPAIAKTMQKIAFERQIMHGLKRRGQLVPPPPAPPAPPAPPMSPKATAGAGVPKSSGKKGKHKK
jgi:bifunctional DNA-binding transcriptional regulator/antitoxin component of YhaV-PrlF toxin-antitoxin module